MRWPVVLKPEPLESLSSWLQRHAKYYRVSMEELFSSGLNMNPINNLVEIDFYKIKNLFLNIESKTGVKEKILHSMTMESLSPRVFDFVDIYTRKALENYTNSFLAFYWIKNKHLIHNSDTDKNIGVMPWVRETPWAFRNSFDRFCPYCVKESNGYKLLPWRLCVLSTCPRHKCFLIEKTNPINKKESKNSFYPENIEPKKELLLLDEMTLNAFNYGEVLFSNGDKMSDMVWFRFLRGLAKQLCVIKNKFDQYIHVKKELLENISLKIDHKIPFEGLDQEKRISIMTSIGILLSDWPNNILSKLHLEWWSKFPYSYKNTVPFSLANHIEITMTYNEIYYYNFDFSMLSNSLKNEGIADETRLELNESQEARENMFKFLTYNNKNSAEEAWRLISGMRSKKISRSGATVYDHKKEKDYSPNSFKELSSN
jgi:hypothetical protein